MTTAGALPSADGDFAGIRALRSREAGYSVARKCLELQGDERRYILPEAASWYQGALGEIEVGKLLTRLGPDWLVLHSVPFGSADTDIDHMVIGPRGIFTLNTKHHQRGSVWVGDWQLRVNNQPTHHLKASLGEAQRVAERLKRKTGLEMRVTPVLVVVCAASINDKRQREARRPAVVEASRLVDWLRTYPKTVTDSEAELATLAAEEPDTWHVDPHAVESLRVMQRFERLRAAVGKQRVVVAAPAPAAPPRAAAPPRFVSAPQRRPTRRPKRRGPGVVEQLIKLGASLLGIWIAYHWLTNYLAQVATP